MNHCYYTIEETFICKAGLVYNEKFVIVQCERVQEAIQSFYSLAVSTLRVISDSFLSQLPSTQEGKAAGENEGRKEKTNK